MSISHLKLKLKHSESVSLAIKKYIYLVIISNHNLRNIINFILFLPLDVNRFPPTMDDGSWEQFFAVHLPPTDFEDNRSLLKEFCERHDRHGHKIVLVTVSVILLL